MMSDLDVAIIMLKVAADVDGKCTRCRTAALNQAMELAPHLPWGMAARGLHDDSVTKHGEEGYAWAFEDIRARLNDGDRP